MLAIKILLSFVLFSLGISADDSIKNLIIVHSIKCLEIDRSMREKTVEISFNEMLSNPEYANPVELVIGKKDLTIYQYFTEVKDSKIIRQEIKKIVVNYDNIPFFLQEIFRKHTTRRLFVKIEPEVSLSRVLRVMAVSVPDLDTFFFPLSRTFTEGGVTKSEDLDHVFR